MDKLDSTYETKSKLLTDSQTEIREAIDVDESLLNSK